MAEAGAAVARAHRHHARRITVVGASLGGITAVRVAARLDRRIDAMVDLSGELRWGGNRSLPAAHQVDVPALFAVSRGDPEMSPAQMRKVYAAVPGHAKRLLVVGHGLHGWDLLAGRGPHGWTPLAHRVAAWIHGRYT